MMMTSLLSGFGCSIWTAKTVRCLIPSFLVLYVLITFELDMSIHALTCKADILDIVDNLYARPSNDQKVS